MANIKQAKKRARQNVKCRLHNAGFRSLYRTTIKGVVAAIESGNKEEATKLYKDSVSVLDKMVHKGIVHKNKVARHKSRLAKRITTM